MFFLKKSPKIGSLQLFWVLSLFPIFFIQPTHADIHFAFDLGHYQKSMDDLGGLILRAWTSKEAHENIHLSIFYSSGSSASSEKPDLLEVELSYQNFYLTGLKLDDLWIRVPLTALQDLSTPSDDSIGGRNLLKKAKLAFKKGNTKSASSGFSRTASPLSSKKSFSPSLPSRQLSFSESSASSPRLSQFSPPIGLPSAIKSAFYLKDGNYSTLDKAGASRDTVSIGMTEKFNLFNKKLVLAAVRNNDKTAWKESHLMVLKTVLAFPEALRFKLIGDAIHEAFENVDKPFHPVKAIQIDEKCYEQPQASSKEFREFTFIDLTQNWASMSRVISGNNVADCRGILRIFHPEFFKKRTSKN